MRKARKKLSDLNLMLLGYVSRFFNEICTLSIINTAITLTLLVLFLNGTKILLHLVFTSSKSCTFYSGDCDEI